MRKYYLGLSGILLFLMIAFFCVSCKKTSQERLCENNKSALPSLSIITAGDSILYTQPRVKIPGYAVYVDADGDTLYNDSLAYIKSRGNGTFWGRNKKSFAIKTVYPTYFFPLQKAKKYVLLSNNRDESHIRTAIGLDIAHEFGLLAPSYTYVSLFLNGDYKGLYQMTEKVRVDRKSVNIHDLEKENRQLNALPLEQYAKFSYGKPKEKGSINGYRLANSPENLSGGFLLEYAGLDGSYSRAESAFVSHEGDLLSLESPKHASEEELRYIQSYYDAVERAILDTTNNEYTKLIDVESFARYYLFQELMLNIDGGFSSFYMYKDIDGKLMAGPVWDLDLTLMEQYWRGNCIPLPNMLWVAAPWGEVGRETSRGILYHLCKRTDFWQFVKSLYVNEIGETVHNYLNSGRIESLIEKLTCDVQQDYQRNGNRQSRNWDEAVNRPVEFLKQRTMFMDWLFTASPDSMVCLTVVQNDEAEYAPHDRGVQYYYAKNKPISLPQRNINSNFIFQLFKLSSTTWYIAGTDSVLSDGMCLSESKRIYMKPLWYEPIKSRINKMRKGAYNK